MAKQSNYKVFDGSDWVDPCNKEIRLLKSITTTNGVSVPTFELLDPENRKIKYYDGTAWIPMKCKEDICYCPSGYTADPITGLCVSNNGAPALFDGTLAVIGRGAQGIGSYGQDGLLLYPLQVFNQSDNIRQDSQTTFIKGNTVPAPSINPVNANDTFKAPVWTSKLTNCGVAQYIDKAWNRKSAYSVGDIVLFFNPVLNQFKKHTALNAISANLTSPFNPTPLVDTANWSPGQTLTYEVDIDKTQTAYSFKYCLDLTSSKVYHIGFAGDNQCIVEIQLNSQGNFYPVAKTGINTNFYNWYVIPIELPSGNHTLKLTGKNDSNAVSTGIEIYDMNIENTVGVDSVEKFKQKFLYAPGTTSIEPLSHASDQNFDLNPYIIFSTNTMVNKSVPIPNEIDPATGQPYAPYCENGTTLNFCNGAPVCTITTECSDVPVAPTIDATTEINIWFDDSGSMDDTLTPLEVMRDTVLKPCLLPFYNNDETLYLSKVRILNMSLADEDGYNDESFIKCIGKKRNYDRPVDTTVGLVINLAFGDESNDYGYGSDEVFDESSRTGYYDNNINITKANLLTAASENYNIRGTMFRIATVYEGTTIERFPGFSDLVEATFVSRGVYAPPFNLADEFAASIFNYEKTVTAESTPVYYRDKIVSALQNLGISIPAC